MPAIKTRMFLAPVTFNTSATHLLLYILFFISGAAALIYQVAWQRMLFTLFGVDLESVTIIVSVFMFGLGIGGLAGGYFADRLQSKLLMLYILIEIGVASFGFLSPFIFDKVGQIMSTSNEFAIGSVSFLMLAFPTILMGATFPILVTHVNRMNQHIGRSVGSLYFANTLGGALGAYFSGFVLLYSMDLDAVIYRAAYLNLAVAITALLLFRGKKSC